MTETISPVFLTGLAIVIVALGLGVYSTYTSFKKRARSRERAFLLASSLACWTLVMVVLLSELFLPNPFSYYMLIAVLFAARSWATWWTGSYERSGARRTFGNSARMKALNSRAIREYHHGYEKTCRVAAGLNCLWSLAGRSTDRRRGHV
jgi:hypothetical protein